MNIFANKNIKHLFLAILLISAASVILAEVVFYIQCRTFSAMLLLIALVAFIAILTACFLYFKRQDKLMQRAVSQIDAYLAGDTNARIECDEEGEIYRLFHAVNSLAAVLNAHVTNESQEKEFLKNTISDISHQLKTPLAALNIYNGLLQDETADYPELKEFTALSEHELDRIETLVQNLLKITRLDAGTIIFEKSTENISDMMQDIRLHFAYRAKSENKKLELSGSGDIYLDCDRDWLNEAIDNIVKNALDHTADGDTVSIAWQEFSGSVQITISDNGCGIHPEDLHYIFKRFYRSRFSKDKQGIGLGLSLSKAIIEAHNGIIDVDSIPGNGTTFTISFLR